ncbi:hypothetical protein [Pedobacter sp. GR22-10]|uniref:hypothetical protein n=1 Tax=Pedobacter sp. GR22-10 TaxID=2994472 RepID=UPI0022467AF5|nr:hypothetical protein [Pedobacter sp. GR22-10]MCX2431108.1 hypothetical protein [Pedobacter sp. GR22-10]
MGQAIATIVTKEQINIPESIIHFNEKDLTVIILDLYPNDVSWFVKLASTFVTFPDFVNDLKQKDFMFDFEDEQYRDNELEALIDLIESLEMKSWAIEWYSEWADLIEENHFMAVINNLIIQESCIHRDNDEDYVPINKYKWKMALNTNYHTNRSRYLSYDIAKQEYNQR